MNAWECSLKSWINPTGNEENNRRVTFSKKVRNVQHKKGSVAPFIEHSYVHTGVIVTCTQGSPVQSYGYTVIGSLKLSERATDMISSKTGSEYTGRPCMVTVRFVSSSSRVRRVLVSSLSREWLSLFRWLPDSFSLLAFSQFVASNWFAHFQFYFCSWRIMWYNSSTMGGGKLLCALFPLLGLFGLLVWSTMLTLWFLVVTIHQSWR